MADFGAVRQTLCDALEAATGMQTYTSEPENVSVPCAVVRPGSPFAAYEMRMGGSITTTWRVEVVVLASRIADTSGHTLLNTLVSPGPDGVVSVMNKTRFDGQPFRVIEGTQYGTVTVGGATYLGAQLVVELLA